MNPTGYTKGPKPLYFMVNPALVTPNLIFEGSKHTFPWALSGPPHNYFGKEPLGKICPPKNPSWETQVCPALGKFG